MLLLLGIIVFSFSAILSQRAPCYQCELFKGAHPEAKPYEQVRSHCTLPCDCPKVPPSCSGLDGPPIRDGCGCCLTCPSSIGGPCGGSAVCSNGLRCHYIAMERHGTCKVEVGQPCVVHNTSYVHGETFRPDCRTQCTCQNGIYACSSLCPQENIRPEGTSCSRPQLVEVAGQCCREWLCDAPKVEQPAQCIAAAGRWSECSQRCGVGVARRRTTDNLQCHLVNKTRICQNRPCNQVRAGPEKHHHVRKGRDCKATQRSGASRIRVGPCVSQRKLRPKLCGICTDPNKCCKPVLSTTIKVDLVCRHRHTDIPENDIDMIIDLLEPGTDLWTLEAPAHKTNGHKHKREIEENSDSTDFDELKNVELLERFYPILDSRKSFTSAASRKASTEQIDSMKDRAHSDIDRHYSSVENTRKASLQSHSSLGNTRKASLQSHSSVANTRKASLQSHSSLGKNHHPSLRSHSTVEKTHHKSLRSHNSDESTLRSSLHSSNILTKNTHLASHSNQNSLKNTHHASFPRYNSSDRSRHSSSPSYSSVGESIITVNVQWILKCQCEYNCDSFDSGSSREQIVKVKNKVNKKSKKKFRRAKKEDVTSTTIQDGALLHRVHRTTVS